MIPLAMIRGPVSKIIQDKYPDLPNDVSICFYDINGMRSEYVYRTLQDVRNEISDLTRKVDERVGKFQERARAATKELGKAPSFGQRLADTVASFGGSWTFIIIFMVVIAAWMIINSLLLLNRSFDPYPYILLNLLLSCLAAIQAPIIMMSQNRLETRDRKRQEHDLVVNLKAEMEVHNLNDKLDMLISRQWQRLLEIQEIQMELMGELTYKLK